jgi:thiamine pyrophosphate-dependent acetolactate synthase large subunit-like protein
MPVVGVNQPGRHSGTLLAGLLAEHGVRHVFGVPGGRPAELGAGLASALGHGRPALVDVVTEAWETPIGGRRSAVAQGATSGYGG